VGRGWGFAVRVRPAGLVHLVGIDHVGLVARADEHLAMARELSQFEFRSAAPNEIHEILVVRVGDHVSHAARRKRGETALLHHVLIVARLHHGTAAEHEVELLFDLMPMQLVGVLAGRQSHHVKPALVEACQLGQAPVVHLGVRVQGVRDARLLLALDLSPSQDRRFFGHCCTPTKRGRGRPSGDPGLS